MPEAIGEKALRSKNASGSVKGRAKPAIRRLHKSADKPPMPEHMEASAAKAIKRHRKRLLSPGVAVEVVKIGEPYVVASPHADSAAWEAMVCDAVGTRSVGTAKTFLYQLTELCSQNWHPAEVEGEYGQWCPDELELNMVLNMVTGIRPRNELEAAQAAQMVAVHLMTMRVSARALRGAVVVPQDAAIAGKLARTFVMQAEGLSRLRGRKPTTRQTITVRQEKHVHNHQHVHVEGGGLHNGGQPHAAMEGRISRNDSIAALPSPNQDSSAVPVSRSDGKASVQDARRSKGFRSA